MIVRDGEGATRVMEIDDRRGARPTREAKAAAHAVATSPLVKTALHGGDPNWGRILAAVGPERRAVLAEARLAEARAARRSCRTASRRPTAKRTRRRIFARERVPRRRGSRRRQGDRPRSSPRDLGHDYVSLERGLPELPEKKRPAVSRGPDGIRGRGAYFLAGFALEGSGRPRRPGRPGGAPGGEAERGHRVRDLRLDGVALGVRVDQVART